MLALTSDFRMRDADDDGANVEMLGKSWWRARWIASEVSGLRLRLGGGGGRLARVRSLGKSRMTIEREDRDGVLGVFRISRNMCSRSS